jgi:predicted metalloprotease with PDZ domain
MKATDMQRSLDDVMKLLYNDKGIIESGYTARDYQLAMEKVAGISFVDLFANCFHGTADYLPYLKEALQWLGLELNFVTDTDLWHSKLGIRYSKDAGGNIVVEGVMPGCPADRAGLWKGDIITKVNGAAPDTNSLPDQFHIEWQSYGVDRKAEIKTDGRTYYDIPGIQPLSDQRSFQFWKFRQK